MSFLTKLTLIVVFSCVAIPQGWAKQDNTSSRHYNQSADDEKIIRSQSVDYAKYFEQRNAHAISELWSNDGVLVDISGKEFNGRSEIEELYKQYFTLNPSQKLEVQVQSIRFPASNVAIEEGITRLSGSKSDAGSKYILVHVKNNGIWQITNSNEVDLTSDSSNPSLTELSWLIGDWTPEIARGRIKLNMAWFANHSFINCTCSLPGREVKDVSDLQIIGWDASKARPTSWNFTNTGAFGAATWNRKGDYWLLHGHSIQEDGGKGEATYILHKLNNDSFTWQSVRRSLDDMPLPDTPEIKMVRL